MSITFQQMRCQLLLGILQKDFPRYIERMKNSQQIIPYIINFYKFSCSLLVTDKFVNVCEEFKVNYVKYGGLYY